jgi:LMBR1 domain-containing protein 1
MTMIIFVAFIIPFTLFYYESDSEKCAAALTRSLALLFCACRCAAPVLLGSPRAPPTHAAMSTRRNILERILEAGQYWFVFMIIIALVLGCAYGIEGYVDYHMETLTSGLVRISTDMRGSSSCIPAGSWQPSLKSNTGCDSVNGFPASEKWSVRVTFPVYCIALATVCGWLLFMVFAGVGLVALPVDLIKSYMYRPQKMITKTEYIRLACDIGKKAKVILDGLREAQTDARRNGRSRRTRRAISALSSELVQLEEEELKLREVYPQSEDAELSWALTVLGYALNAFGGIISVGLSGTWLVHILVYMFLSPPLDPLLNTMFIQMDDVFGLFGTAAFAVFCFYLVVVTLKGNFKVGLNLLFFTVHPMAPGATLMSSFLFNTALIMLCSISIIQFCASAFDEYANETSVDEIFGNQITNLRGLGVVFQYNVFVFCLFIFAGLAGISLPFLNRTKPKPKKNFDETYEGN